MHHTDNVYPTLFSPRSESIFLDASQQLGANAWSGSPAVLEDWAKDGLAAALGKQ